MYLLIKPASGACDLGCKYCFYTDEMSCRSEAVRGMMKTETVSRILGKALERCAGHLPPEPLSVGFQGGEPLLCSLDFYKDFVSYVKKVNKKYSK